MNTRIIACFLLVAMVAGLPAWAHLNDTPGPAIREMVRSADFVFRGRVLAVQYRSAEMVPLLEGSAPALEEGQPVFQDGSGVPHTFVTYAIEEIYKGKAPRLPNGGPSDKVILRLLGGPASQNPDEIVFVPTYPHMDINDQDILMVKNNTINGCPLVGAEAGRFRILADPQSPTEPPRVYTDRGFEVVYLATTQNAGQIDTGQFHLIPAVHQFSIGNHLIEREVILEENEYTAPGSTERPEPNLRKGPHFEAGQFSHFLHLVVAELYTPAELNNLPPVVSANPLAPFVIEPQAEFGLVDLGLEPDPQPLPRPWLAELPEARQREILEAERLEAELTGLTGGDPVLPATPCERAIFAGGAIPADISGPQGKPDCVVDLFDLRELSAYWLTCLEPACPPQS